MGTIILEDTTGTPALPPTGNTTLFVDDADAHVKQLTSTGAVLDLTLGANGTPASLVVINDLSDFLFQDADTITLKAFKTYDLGADVDVGARRFICENNVKMTATNPGTTLTTTTTGDVFTGVNHSEFTLDTFLITMPNAAQLLNFVDSSPDSIVVIRSMLIVASGPSVVACEKFGTTDVGNIVVENSAVVGGLGANDGLTLSGTAMGAINIVGLLLPSVSPTFVGLDLGSTVISFSCLISQLRCFNPEVSAVGISGLSTSGNLGAGLEGSVTDCIFASGMTATSNIVPQDVRWNIRNSPPLADSTTDIFGYMSVMETVTIANAGVFVPIAGGNWLTLKASRFAMDSDGIITYLGERPTTGYIIGEGSISKTGGGGGDNVAVRVAIDSGSGFAVPHISTQGRTNAASPDFVKASFVGTINPADRFQIWTSNLDNAVGVDIEVPMRVITIDGF